MAMSKYVICFFILFLTFPSFGEVNRYMVFFTDKNDNAFNINNPEQFLSKRALDRRANQNIKISINDLPVSDVYVSSLNNLDDLDVYFSTKWMNGVLVEIDEGKIEEINALPYVANVVLVAHGSKLGSMQNGGRKYKEAKSDFESFDGVETKEQNEFIGVDDMHSSGYHGEDMLIAIFDSGFGYINESSFFTHVFEQNKLLSSKDFIRGSDNVFQYDVHGSKVLSCISGFKEGVYSGTAPEANIVLCVTEDIQSEFSIEEYNWLFAAEFADSIGVDVINSSVGYSYFDDDRMNYTYEDLDGRTTVIAKAANIVASKGILVVCSNGNEGNNSWQYLNSPADADSILAVGAATFDLDRANFSSFGPTSDGRIKPDISALGSWVKIALQEEITYANGTSFSAPMVAGLAAGLWQAFPELTSQEVIQYLKMTSSQSDAPDTLLGYGIPNFRRAYNRIKVTEGEVSNKYVVFPNPVDNRRIISFYVDTLADDKRANINFYDLKGSYIMGETLTVKSELDPIEIDVSFLKPGSYILTYKNGQLEKKLKLVVL